MSKRLPPLSTVFHQQIGTKPRRDTIDELNYTLDPPPSVTSFPSHLIQPAVRQVPVVQPVAVSTNVDEFKELEAGKAAQNVMPDIAGEKVQPTLLKGKGLIRNRRVGKGLIRQPKIGKGMVRERRYGQGMVRQRSNGKGMVRQRTFGKGKFKFLQTGGANKAFTPCRMKTGGKFVNKNYRKEKKKGPKVTFTTRTGKVVSF